MRILGIETSCDETSAAIVEGFHVQSNVIASSSELFTRLGGVIPEQAARKQVECIIPVIEAALHEGQCDKDTIDAIAVTRGPGLLGSLVVGTSTARMLSALWNGKPLIGVHHHLGHLVSPWLDVPSHDQPQFPILTLSVSGGHTELWFRTDHAKGMLIGQTRDDAAGEAFDKGAYLLGLPYPGGPAVEQCARKGNRTAYTFPQPLAQYAKTENIEFSFSGLKTALRYMIEDHMEGNAKPLSENMRNDLAACYEHAITQHLCSQTIRTLKKYPVAKELHVVGGVSANLYLQNFLTHAVKNIPVRFPAKKYCTDNAAMIAAAGGIVYRNGYEKEKTPWITHASLSIETCMETIV